MLAFLLLSRENRWSSKSHHACMFGRVVTEVNAVKIRPMGQIFRQLFRYQPSKSPAADLFSSEARCSSYDSRGKIPVSCSVVTNLPTWWWSSSCANVVVTLQAETEIVLAPALLLQLLRLNDSTQTQTHTNDLLFHAVKLVIFFHLLAPYEPKIQVISIKRGREWLSHTWHPVVG